MRFPTKASKAAAAAVVALALPLAACGSGEETTGGGLSTAASAPTGSVETATTVEQADDAKTSEEAAPSESKAKSEDKASTNAEAAGSVPTIANPFENGDFAVPTFEPIEGGKEGSDADRKQMEETVRAVTNPESFEKWTRVIIDNSCKKVTEPAIAEMERQGISLESIEQAARMQEQAGQSLEIPKTDVSVSDVRVDGNRASATVKTKNDSSEETQTQIFEKEDGRWKLCN